MAYRAEIQIGVKGARSVKDLSKKIDRVASVIDRLNNERFSVAQKASKITAFQVAQEQKLISARQKYNDGLRESIALAIQFQDRIERAVRAAQTSRAESSRTLTGSKLAGLLPATPTKALLPAAGGTGAGAKAFERAAARAQKIDAFYKEVALFLKNIDQQIEQRRQAVKTVQSAVSRQPAAQPFGLLPPGRSVSSASAAPQRQEVSAAREVAAVRQVTGALTSNLQIQQKIKELKRTGVTLDQQLDDLTRQRLGASGEIVKQINSQIASTRQLRRENNTAIKDLSENLRNLPSGGFVQGSRSPISGNRDLNRNVRQSLRLEARLNNLKLEGLKTTKAESLLNELNNNLSKKDLNTTSAGLKTQKELIQDLRQELSLTKEIANSRSQGTKQQGGSRRGGGRLQNAVSSGLIGGAFPLLFGQGPGAAVGGGLGGFGGGLAGGQLGFGLSLVGTQIGAAVDQTITSITNLSSSLREPTAALAALGEAGIKVNSSVALQIQQLESAGKAYEAQALLLDTVAQKLGVDAVAQLQALDDAQEQTQQHISDFKSTLIVSLLPALLAAADTVNVFAATLSKLSNIKIPTPFGKDVKLDIPKTFAQTVLSAMVPGGPAFTQLANKAISSRPKPELQAPELTPAQQLSQQTKQLKATTGIGSSRLENEITELIGENLKRNNDLTDATVVANKKLIISKTEQNKENKLSAAIEQKRLKEAITADVLQKEGLDRDIIRNEAVNQNLQLTNSVNAAQEKAAAAQEKAANTQERKTKSAERQLKIEQDKLRRAAEATRLLSISADLAEYTTGQDKAIADALRDGNKELAYKLQIARELTILDFERNKIQDQTTSTVDKNLKTRIAEAGTLGRLNALEGSRLDLVKKAKEAFEQQLSRVQDEINLSKARLEGRLEEEKIDQAINNLRKENTEISEIELNQLRQKLELLNSQKSLEEAFNIQQKTKFAGAGLQAGFIGQAGKAFEGKRQEGASIEDATKIANLTQQMELAQVQAQALESAVLGIGNAFATAMTTGVSELIAGTKSAQEVFADFLKNIGDALVSAATQMIATYIAIGIAKAFAGMSGGGGGGGTTPPSTIPGGAVQTGPGLNIGGIDQGIAPKGFAANGGPVLGGQPYMVGERGPELFVPGQSGGVMRNEDMRSLMGRSPASGGAPSMNFSFETTSIGGTEYVSREQLESAMAVTRKQASNDGAKRGMSMTLDKMQNSPRTRTRIGLR